MQDTRWIIKPLDPNINEINEETLNQTILIQQQDGVNFIPCKLSNVKYIQEKADHIPINYSHIEEIKDQTNEQTYITYSSGEPSLDYSNIKDHSQQEYVSNVTSEIIIHTDKPEINYVDSYDAQPKTTYITPTYIEIKKFTCDECDFRTNEKCLLTRHKLVHSNIKKFACTVCDFRTKYKSVLNTHMVIHANDGKSYTCDVCQFRTKTKSVLNTHMQVHTGTKIYQCEVCDYKSNQKTHLNKHMLLHSDVKKYACDQCNYKSKQKGNLNSHKLIHSNVKKYGCDECDYRTNFKNSLNRHKIIHIECKHLNCDECDFKTNRKSNLNRHKLIHSYMKLFSAEVEDKSSTLEVSSSIEVKEEVEITREEPIVVRVETLTDKSNVPSTSQT